MAMIFWRFTRHIRTAEPAVGRIGAIVAAEHGVLIGDAPGPMPKRRACSAALTSMSGSSGRRTPRNNLGDWAVAAIHRPWRSRIYVHARRTARWRSEPIWAPCWDGMARTCLNVLRLALDERLRCLRLNAAIPTGTGRRTPPPHLTRPKADPAPLSSQAIDHRPLAGPARCGSFRMS
jgi:hypothetical protein